MSTTIDVVLGIGASLGDRHLWLRRATATLAAVVDIAVVRVSRPVWSRGVGPHPGPFLNAAVRIQTQLAPCALLKTTQMVEQRLGRRPGPRWGARAIDVDILVIDGLVMDQPDLVVPHRELLRRSFALGPAAEVAPDLVHPLAGEPLSVLAERVPGRTWPARGALLSLAGNRVVR